MSVSKKVIINNLTEKIVKNIFEGFQRGENVFNVISMLPEPVDFSDAISTSHWHNDRNNRSQRYENEEKGEGVYSFIVNTGHPNGFEVHTITDKAFIIIQNEQTERLVTILAARPGQIKRYWLRRDEELPNNSIFRTILRNASNNRRMGLNNL